MSTRYRVRIVIERIEFVQHDRKMDLKTLGETALPSYHYKSEAEMHYHDIVRVAAGVVR